MELRRYHISRRLIGLPQLISHSARFQLKFPSALLRESKAQQKFSKSSSRGCKTFLTPRTRPKTLTSDFHFWLRQSNFLESFHFHFDFSSETAEARRKLRQKSFSAGKFSFVSVLMRQSTCRQLGCSLFIQQSRMSFSIPFEWLESNQGEQTNYRDPRAQHDGQNAYAIERGLSMTPSTPPAHVGQTKLPDNVRG